MDNIYRDIAERTGGDIYIGVVGPVRTGKSTFIKRFMESMVLPNMEGDYDRQRTRDELPQSAAGRTVMTTEPKFIPDEAVTVTIGENVKMKVKMIDCVGFIIPEALGNVEEGSPRMVNTPWTQSPVPFEEAAEMGTRKVIRDHSTIGIVVTSDGTIGNIPRENYMEAEEKTIKELKKTNKPFAIILNSSDPASHSSEALALELEEKYNAPVALVNCLELNEEDIRHILQLILLEFPIREISFKLPSWTGALDKQHPIRKSIFESISSVSDIHKMGEIQHTFQTLMENDHISAIRFSSFDMGKGRAEIQLELPESLYYQIIGELTGIEVKNDDELFRTMRTLAEIKKEYDKFVEAIDDVNSKGYGIVLPDVDDLTLEEPEIIKQAGSYGVRLRASAPSIHMIRANIETELNPMVGTEEQSEEIIKYLLHEFDEDPKKIWGSNLFGKSLYELVNEGLHSKLGHMPDDARQKIGETLARIINEGSGGLICILL